MYKTFGNFLRYASSYSVLNKSQERQYLKNYKNTGKECYKKALILHNLKFVASVAIRYNRDGVEPMELINEGILGLDAGIERFNLESNQRLLTFSVYWIRAKIGEYLRDKVSTIRLPANRYNELRSALRKCNLKNAELDDENNMLFSISQPRGMSEIISDGTNNIELGDTIACENDETDSAEHDSTKSAINKILSTLNNQEMNVVSMLSGITSGEKQTLEQVGSELNISTERVRQIRNKAFESLRCGYSNELKELLHEMQ